MTVLSSALTPQRSFGLDPRVFIYAMRLSVHCNVLYSTVYFNYVFCNDNTRMIFKDEDNNEYLLLSKLESWLLGKALLVRMAIISLRLHHLMKIRQLMKIHHLIKYTSTPAYENTPSHLLLRSSKAIIHY